RAGCRRRPDGFWRPSPAHLLQAGQRGLLRRRGDVVQVAVAVAAGGAAGGGGDALPPAGAGGVVAAAVVVAVAHHRYGVAGHADSPRRSRRMRRIVDSASPVWAAISRVLASG